MAYTYSVHPILVSQFFCNAVNKFDIVQHDEDDQKYLEPVIPFVVAELLPQRLEQATCKISHPFDGNHITLVVQHWWDRNLIVEWR